MPNLLEGITFSLDKMLAGGIFLAGLIFIFIADLVLQKASASKRKQLLGTYLIGTLLAALAAIWILSGQDIYPNVLFNGYLVLNQGLVWLKGLMILMVLLVVLLFGSGQSDPDADFSKGEFHFFVLSMLLGASFLSMAANFLSLIMGMEILSLSAYALTGFRSSRLSAGHALRYFLLGAVATAVMLYGISFLYGFTGTLQWQSPEFWEGLASIPKAPLGLFFGMFLVGFLFKVAAVPFHFWVTGVYKAAPWSAVTLFALLPKLASMAVLYQLSTYWQPLHDFIIPFLSGIILLSLLVGNFSALLEKDARVLMAWASIAQAGFLLSFLLLDSQTGYNGLYFYLCVYVTGILGAFWLIHHIAGIKGSFDISKWASGPSVPVFYGVLITLFMVSLIGIPPMAGFTAKFFLFAGMAEAYTSSSDSWLLAVLLIGVLTTAVSAFYYLRIPYFLLVAAKADEEQKVITTPRYARSIFIVLLALVLLMLFLKPSLLTLALNSLTFTLP
jgi:NADH-quinone oxidoreductase subunit N